MRTLFVLGTLTISSWALAAEGPIPQAEIKKTVDSHLSDVRGCAKDNGAATGKLVVEFAIDAEGNVQNPKPKEHSSNDALDKCIAKAFGRWKFPKPKGGVLMGVVYPFTFSVPKPTPQGTLPQDKVVETVKSHNNDVRGCYDLAAKEAPGFKGTAQIAFVVSPEGKISEAKVQAPSGAPKLDSCLVDKLKTWQWPKPEGGEAAFVYPFIFGGK